MSLADHMLAADVFESARVYVLDQLTSYVVRRDLSVFARDRHAYLALAYNKLDMNAFRCRHARMRLTAHCVRNEHFYCRKVLTDHVEKYANVYARNDWRVQG